MTSDERIAQLETAVAELRAALAAAKPGAMRSMAHTHRCPACGGGKLFHFKRVQDLAHSGMVDLTLQKQYSTWWGLKLEAGALEAYACRTCRLVEWHAISLDLVQPDADVVAIEAPADDGGPRGVYR